MTNDRDVPPKCPHMRTDSSCQAGPVSQNQIRKCEQDIQFCGLFLQTSVSCFSEMQLLLHNSKDMFHFGSYGRFLALPALDLCSGSIGVVLALRWTTIDFVTNAFAVFVCSYRFRTLFGSEITAVSVDNLLLSGQKFCRHTDIVFIGGCNFQCVHNPGFMVNSHMDLVSEVPFGTFSISDSHVFGTARKATGGCGPTLTYVRICRI